MGGVSKQRGRGSRVRRTGRRIRTRVEVCHYILLIDASMCVGMSWCDSLHSECSAGKKNEEQERHLLHHEIYF